MKKTIIVVSLLVAVVAGYFVGTKGGFVNSVKDGVAKLTASGNWTEERRAKDPLGYSKFVEAKLKKSNEAFKTNRAGLDKACADLNLKIREKEAAVAKKEQTLETFLAALDKGEFPVEIYDQKYGSDQLDQLRAQIVRINQQLQAAQNAVETFREVRSAALNEQIRIVGAIDQNETVLATINAKREIFKSQQSSDECQELVAQMSAAFEGTVAQENSTFSIRSVDEIIAQQEKAQNAENVGSSNDYDQKVDDLLKDFRARRDATQIVE